MDIMKENTAVDTNTPIYSGLYKSIIQYIDINEVIAPERCSLGKETLRQFCASLSSRGFLRPLFIGAGRRLIDGARRLAASKVLGYGCVPCVFAPTPLVFGDDLMILRLREGVSDHFEYAEALRVLTEEYLYSQESVAEALGRSQSFVANKLRLLRFTEEERSCAASFGLTERHCRALLAIPDPDKRFEALRRVGSAALTVGATEEYVASLARYPRSDVAAEFERELSSLVSKYGGKLLVSTSDADGKSSYTLTIS